MEGKAIHIAITSADRAALERIAPRSDDVGLHARIALGHLEGMAIAPLARREHSSRATVRKWIARFLAEGVTALHARSPGRRKTPCRYAGAIVEVSPPDALLPPRGPRTVSSRLRLECSIRDAIATGRLPPGAPLPSRQWLARRFKVPSASSVASAFASLRRDGFVTASRGGETRVAASFPNENRFLLILEGRLPDGEPEGICRNLELAARETSRLCPGVEWTVAWRSGGKADADIAREIALQRYCGVFVRSVHSSSSAPDQHSFLPGPCVFASVPRVPICCYHIIKGTSHSPLLRCLPLSEWDGWETAFRRCVEAGLRSVLVLDSRPWPRSNDMEDAVRAQAASLGVAIPPYGYGVCWKNSDAESRRRFRAMLHIVGADGADAVILRADDALPALAAAMRAEWGEASGRIPVFAYSGGRLLPDEGLSVNWIGPDIVATLLSFMDWARGIRAGSRNLRDPCVVPL